MAPTKAFVGALNLLDGALGLKARDRLTIVAERPHWNLYEPAAAQTIFDAATSITNITPRLFWIDAVDTIDALGEMVKDAIATSSHVVFQARLGDSLRFSSGFGNAAMSYAYTAALLGSPFCTVPYAAMRELQAHLATQFRAGSSWTIASGSGALLVGEVAIAPQEDEMIRFPIMTAPPILSGTARGSVDILPWIVSTGNRAYPLESVILDSSVQIQVEAGRIVEISGSSKDTHRLHSHYERVAAIFDIDPYVLHSWHTGVNTKCTFLRNPRSNLEYWGRSVFGSPRCLHFHTCGDFAPGEICLTARSLSRVTVAGHRIIDNGEPAFYRDRQSCEILRRHALDPESMSECLPVRL